MTVYDFTIYIFDDQYAESRSGRAAALVLNI